jgi:hypothetical protein
MMRSGVNQRPTFQPSFVTGSGRRSLLLVALAAGMSVARILPAGAAPDDGRRAVDVPQFGVCVRAPLAWTLIQWAQEDHAFELRLPQEQGSPPGSVSCQLEFAAGTLEQWRKQCLARYAQTKDPDPTSKLVSDELEQLDAQRFKSLAAQKIGQRWVRLSESQSKRGRKTFELTNQMLYGGIVYAFSLRTDEEHFDAYRADFDDLCAAARFCEPTQGLAQLPGGFWLQRDYGFALWLPAGFQPAFGAKGKILLSANRPPEKNVGKKAETIQEAKPDAAIELAGAAELLLVGAAGAPLDLDALHDSLPGEIVAADAKARVDRCELVRQGQSRALETVVQTVRDEQPIVIFARRFRGQTRNYELRATCAAGEFAKYLERWRRAADSFREVEVKKADGVL